MLVVLIVAAVMLVTNVFKSADRTENTESPSMLLQHVASELVWIEGFKDSTTVSKEIHPELTPFFFEPVRINFASEEMLRTLPGIGPGLAKKIVAFRNIHGTIQSKEECMHIEGIGLKRFADLENHISFH